MKVCLYIYFCDLVGSDGFASSSSDEDSDSDDADDDEEDELSSPESSDSDSLELSVNRYLNKKYKNNQRMKNCAKKRLQTLIRITDRSRRLHVAA